MAWVRRVRTASGATAVQIAEYVDGRRRIVAHVGSAHTEAELGLLLERARGMLTNAGQDELDLGVEATPRKARLVSAVTSRSLFPVLDTQAAQPIVQPARVAAPGLSGRRRGCCSTCSRRCTPRWDSRSSATTRSATW